MRRAVVLFSGGLDSMLAARILQRQGFEIDALNIRTTFDCCKVPAAQTAVEMGIRLTVLSVDDNYIDLIRQPRYGYGKGMNPCIDCRIRMCEMAREFMERVGACLVATGEVVGQRPKSQKRRDLEIIARSSGLDGHLLRPLSAKLLPATAVELEGIVDRERLYAFSGRGRVELIALAEELGLPSIPQPSTGCALTETTFAPRVRDLLTHRPTAARWEFELLNVGRHIRLDEETKIVIGRNAGENAVLELAYRRAASFAAAFLHPENFLGPDAMILGRVDEASIDRAASLILRYTRRFGPRDAQVRLVHAGTERIVAARVDNTTDQLPLL